MTKTLSRWASYGALIAVLSTVSATAHAETTAELYRQSYALEASYKYPDALARMKSIKAQGVSTYFSLARTGWLALLAQDNTLAISSYREAMAKKPKAIEPQLGLTSALLASQKWRELEKACRDILKSDAKNAAARARLAIALYQVGNYPDTSTLYRKLVEEYPGDLNYKTGLGWALLKMGRRDEARKVFSRVLEVSPDNPNAKAGMAQ